jgi:hypothetical protein
LAIYRPLYALAFIVHRVRSSLLAQLPKSIPFLSIYIETNGNETNRIDHIEINHPKLLFIL